MKSNAVLNVIQFAATQRKKATPSREHFRVLDYDNASGSTSHRVSGYKVDGSRIRENYANEGQAKVRATELNLERLGQSAPLGIKATTLTDAELSIARTAFLRLGVGNAPDLIPAVEAYLAAGRKGSLPESPRLDEAFTIYREWLPKSGLRPRTIYTLGNRVGQFVNGTPNRRVSDLTVEDVERWLAACNVADLTRLNLRKALSSFFRWCADRPRRWCIHNVARDARTIEPETPPPAVLTVDQCEKLMLATEAHEDGLLAPYVTLCLFCGLRPSEAERLPWSQVNLQDAEITLHANQVKTGRGRVLKICDTALAWLKKYRGKPIFPPAWRENFVKVRKLAGITSWPQDVLRHSAISHAFRKTGSYGLCAEQFGNSESVIRKHYQGRVSSDDTKAFYSILPSGKEATK
jgi:integrase